MKVLCIHFKGGVGKSTTAIHVAGVLYGSGKTLLVDGDRQVNSYSFFNQGFAPATDDAVEVNDTLSIIPLNSLKPFGKFGLNERIAKIKKQKFDHLVFDTTPDPLTANRIISEVEPDLILIPVKYDDFGGWAQLTPVLQTIKALGAAGINPAVKIVPIGIQVEVVKEFLKNFELDVGITQPVPANPDLFGQAIFRDRQFAWNYAGHEPLFLIYQDAVSE